MLRSFFLSLFVCLLGAACKDSTGPNAGAVGTWRLQTVDGHGLPYTLEQSGQFKMDLTSEVMTLEASGRVTMVTTFFVTDPPNNPFSESVPDEGTYLVNGSTISFTFPSDGSTPSATVSGDMMTLEDMGLTFVYRRD